MTDTLDRPAGAITVHEPHGFVALSNWVGDDLTIVNSARVSYDKVSSWEEYMTTDDQVFTDWDDAMDHEEDLMLKKGGAIMDDIPEPEKRLSEADAGVLNFLMKNRHGTPFEMVWTRWHIKAPIFVFREWHRHRIASINEMSGRYVELKPEFYLPDDEHVRVQVGKPGHYVYEPCGTEVAIGVRRELLASYTSSFNAYKELLEHGIAKEIARACLPVAIYSEMYWACNLRSLLNFLSLRNDNRALREIHDYAAAMESVLARCMPIVHAAFVANGRVAP